MSKHHANNEPEDYKWLVWAMYALAIFIFLCAGGVGRKYPPSPMPHIIEMLGQEQYQDILVILLSILCVGKLIALILMKPKEKDQ